MADADALLIEDYNKGTLTPVVIELAMSLARKRSVPTVVDPKVKNFFAYPGAAVLKPNRREPTDAVRATLHPDPPHTLPNSRHRVAADHLLIAPGAGGRGLLP